MNQREFFWEGSVKSLEEAVQVIWLYNLVTPGKGRPTLENVAARINSVPGYRESFRRAYGADANPDRIVKALSSFLRTLVANDSAWVRFYRGNRRALPMAARRGQALFDGKAGCTNCHSGILLTDLQFHNVGVDTGGHSGRWFKTKDEKDRGAFKTPTLLNIGRSGPYFHDGSVATLEAAVDQMLAGGIENPKLDRANLRPVMLTAGERSDLLLFLRSLNVDYPTAPPKLP